MGKLLGRALNILFVSSVFLFIPIVLAGYITYNPTNDVIMSNVTKTPWTFEDTYNESSQFSNIAEIIIGNK